MARAVGKPIFRYTDRDGRACIHWPKEYKRGDKVEILKHLKDMAKIVDDTKAKKVMEAFRFLAEMQELKLQNDIAKFQKWKKDPGFT